MRKLRQGEMNPGSSEELEVWAGPECSVVRIGDRWRDQLKLTGHADRLEDLDAVASIGIRKIRYPVLWERVAPNDPEECDWRWSDERLSRLRELGIVPIVGLLHHGSGPSYTDLLDPNFPRLLADFAERVARRYPWVEYYTPVNEPLTTARFSGLYGIWHPHESGDRTFVRALLNECRGTAMAMAAIRRVNPGAKLVQTEDIGCVYSTPPLAYQAEFENHRRWMSLDLLCGEVTRMHVMRDYLIESGASQEELDWLQENACPPDIIGANYYITSERFLDHRIELYPAAVIGGNGREKYADVEAVRVLAEGPAGIENLVAQLWERYGLPIAITEAHLGCSREEQLRWLAEVWQAAESVRRNGIDMRAITLWSIFGAYDWDSLLTRSDGSYEPGMWDIRAPSPRPTALVQAAAELARRGAFDHPVLDTAGWWRAPSRLQYPPFQIRPQSVTQLKTGKYQARNLLIAGSGGLLRNAFAAKCTMRGLGHSLYDYTRVDPTQRDVLFAALDRFRPWAILDTGKPVFLSTDSSAADPADDHALAELLALYCAERNIQFIGFSSDAVFHRHHHRPYIESDKIEPATPYGHSKAIMETRIFAALPDALIIRTSPFFDPANNGDWLGRIVQALHSGQKVTARSDLLVTMTYMPDLVDATLDLIVDAEKGIWHLANDGALSPYEMGILAAEIIGVESHRIESAAPLHPVPRYRALSSERGRLMRSFDHALARYFSVHSEKNRDKSFDPAA